MESLPTIKATVKSTALNLYPQRRRKRENGQGIVGGKKRMECSEIMLDIKHKICHN